MHVGNSGRTHRSGEPNVRVGFSASFEDPISTGRIVQDARDLGRRERDESFSVSCTLFRREAPVVLTQPVLRHRV